VAYIVESRPVGVEGNADVRRRRTASVSRAPTTCTAGSRSLFSSYEIDERSTMIHKGDRLENPVTGEVLVFRRTSAETNGEAVVVETIVRPGGFVAATHLHPHQTERFEVLEGTLHLRIDGREIFAGPGDVAVVPPGTPHRFRNAGEGEARFICEVRPALQFESLIETMFSLAAAGKTNRRGMPNPLRLAVIARAHFDTVRLPYPPAVLQRAGLALAAPLGRALGYRETVSSIAALGEHGLAEGGVR
jgi:mannose-6-phosphate isomerase-like protein (cupin superfamily)